MEAYGDTGRAVGQLVLVYRTDAAALENLVAEYEALGAAVDSSGDAATAQVGEWLVELSSEPVPGDPDAFTLVVRLAEQYRFD